MAINTPVFLSNMRWHRIFVIFLLPFYMEHASSFIAGTMTPAD